MQTLEEVTRKINKLLRLANGASDEEAKSAMDKALQLAAENSLDIETAAILGEEKIKSSNEPVDEKVAAEGSKLKITDQFIFVILEKYFNVKVLMSTWNRATRIRFIGTGSDIEIAKEIYARLTEIFQYQWLQYKNKNNVSVENKRIYFFGLQTGISEILEVAKRKMVDRCVELLPEHVNKESARERYQLVLSEPQKRINDFMASKYNKIRHHHLSTLSYNRDVFSDGVNDGRAVDVEGKRKCIMA